jgi:uncharacterized protein (TIGR00730 family)
VIIGVYCGWRDTNPDLLSTAEAVGTAIAEAGHTLLYGGGSLGQMGAVAYAAEQMNGRVIAVTLPEWVEDVDRRPNRELVVVDTLGERVVQLEDKADAYVVLPGGLGTLHELFSTWVSASNGQHAKPIVIVDPTGFFNGLVDWLRRRAMDGHIDPRAWRGFTVTAYPEEAMRLLEVIDVR